jgi:N-acetylglucosamine kinase-like BadF-type ATPase
MQPLFLGVDGGGSHTRAVIADQHGQLLGSGVTGSSNQQAIGFNAATRAIQDAINAALQEAHLLETTRFVAACFGLAGAARSDEMARLNRWAAIAQIAAQWRFVTDAELVLAAGTPQGWGIALIAGTGSIAWGRAPDGQTIRVGGWGYLLGDEGSGYDLALRALRIATQTADGRADATTLLHAVLTAYGLQQPAQLISYWYQREPSRAAIAELSRVVVTLAEQGDPHALALLDQCAAELLRLATTAAEQLNIAQAPLALAGGLVGASQYLRNKLLTSQLITSNYRHYVNEPVLGAVRLAQQMLKT